MAGFEFISPAALGYVVGLLTVGVIALLVGIRLGAHTKVQTPPSDEEQVAAALGVLRRHLERKALADMQAAGGPLWAPDPDRVAELSYGAEAVTSVR